MQVCNENGFVSAWSIMRVQGIDAEPVRPALILKT